MLKIRLQRTGRRNQAQFRVVLTDSKNGPKSGRFKEILGSYEPKSGSVELKKDRIQYWLSVGAQTSGTVHNFLVDQKIVDGKKVNVLPQKSPVVKEVSEEEAQTEAAPAESAEETSEEKTEEAPTEESKEEEATE
jgi:small subunit ribosomal protein S16